MMSWLWSVILKLLEWAQSYLALYGIDVSALDLNGTLAPIFTYLPVVQTVIDVDTGFTILLTGFGVQLVIRAVRWLLACIPGMALGG